jgi:carbon-monoxide dehydrogenase medium subunit
MAKTLGRLKRLPEIEYFSPKTLKEALSLLKKYNRKAKAFAGGTDLLPKMKRREVVPKYLIDLNGIPGLKFIKYEKQKGLRIGADTTLSEILESSLVNRRYPILTEAISQMASAQIRNIGTIGGNLCNAVPSADSAPPLIVLGAQLKIVDPRKGRTVLVEDFFKGPDRTVLANTELVSEIQIPPPISGARGTYLKHTLRREMDLAIVGIAVYLVPDSKKGICKDIKIAMGAVAPVPMRAKKAEEILRGKQLNDDLIENAAQIASEESKPIDDIRGSAEYRREIVRALTKRAIRQSLEKMLHFGSLKNA